MENEAEATGKSSNDSWADLAGTEKHSALLAELNRPKAITTIGDWEWDIATNAVSWSDELYRIYGYEPREILPDYELVLRQMHPASRDEFLRAIDATLNEDRPFEMDYLFCRKDGTEAILHTVGKVVRNKDGSPLRMHGLVQDITEHRLAEKAVQESEKRHRAFLDNLSAGVVAHAPDTTVLYCNQSALQILGLSKEQMVGKAAIDPQWKFLNEDGTDMLLDDYPISFALRTTAELKDYVVGIVHPNQNHATWVLCNSFSARNDGGELEHILISFVDITERKLAEEKIRKGEKEYRALFEQAGDYILLLQVTEDNDLVIVDANQAACKFHGYTREEFVGTPIRDIDRGLDKEQVRALLDRAMSGESLLFETAHLRKDGTIFPVEVSVKLLETGGGPPRLISIERDITNRKQAEAIIEQQQYYLGKSQELGQIGTWELDLKRNKMYWTDENCRIFGVPAGSVVNYEVFIEKVHPDDRRYVDREWKAALGGKPYDIEHRIAIGGTTKWVREKADITFDEKGTAISAIGFTQDITERQQAEYKLRQVTTAVEAASDAIGISDAEGRHVYQNKALSELFGYPTAEELQAAGGGASVVKDPGVAKDMFDAIMGGKSWVGELEMVTKDGRVFPAFERADAIKDASGIVTGLIGIITDITVRKEAEKALYREKELSKRYLDVAAVIIVSLNADGEVTLINRKGCDFLGYEEEEIVGKIWFDNFLPERNRDEVKDVFHKLISGNVELVEYYENTVMTRGGEERLVGWNNNYVTDETGRIIGTIASGEDITERKRMEEALQESEERFRLLMQQSPVVIELYDIDGLQVEVNRAYEELWGFPAAETVNKFNVLKSKEVEETGLMEYVKRAYAGESVKVPVYRFDSTGATEAQGKGRIRWLSTQIYPLKDNAGKVRNIVISHEDISEIKNAEIEREELQSHLQQAQKMEAVGTLAGGIAHDFNNILGAVLGYTELTLGDDRLDDESRENLEEVLSAAKRARELVKQILMFSRKSEETREPIKVYAVIEEACKLLRKTIPTSIIMNLDIDNNTGTVVCDATKIHQIVMNLCTNAYHAMRGGDGELSISLGPVEVNYATAARYPDLSEGRYALLTVKDTGEGMDSLTLSRMFDPFFTTKATGEGTGLGLAVVHGIVKSHNGSIAVESELGLGTTFLIYLPLVSSDEVAETAGESALISGDEHILFVDDEVALAKLGKKMLEQLGYHVTLETVAQRAMETFRANPEAIDIIITDQTMPGMTGDKLAREAKDIRADIPVIICTGYSEVLDAGKADEMGVNALLMKPLERATLARTVRKVLDGSA